MVGEIREALWLRLESLRAGRIAGRPMPCQPALRHERS